METLSKNYICKFLCRFKPKVHQKPKELYNSYRLGNF